MLSRFDHLNGTLVHRKICTYNERDISKADVMDVVGFVFPTC